MSHWICPCSRPHVFIYSHSSASGTAGPSTFGYQYFPARVPSPPVFSIRNACLPCRKWIVRKPTLPNWSQLPQPLSTVTPKPPDRELDRKDLRTMKDPVARAASPYTDPTVKGPRSQILSSSGRFSSATSKSSHLSGSLLGLPSLTSASSAQ